MPLYNLSSSRKLGVGGGEERAKHALEMEQEVKLSAV